MTDKSVTCRGLTKPAQGYKALAPRSLPSWPSLSPAGFPEARGEGGRRTSRFPTFHLGSRLPACRLVMTTAFSRHLLAPAHWAVICGISATVS